MITGELKSKVDRVWDTISPLSHYKPLFKPSYKLGVKRDHQNDQ